MLYTSKEYWLGVVTMFTLKALLGGLPLGFLGVATLMGTLNIKGFWFFSNWELFMRLLNDGRRHLGETEFGFALIAAGILIAVLVMAQLSLQSNRKA